MSDATIIILLSMITTGLMLGMIFSLVAVGMYLFLRALKLSTVPSVLAAAAFSFSVAMPRRQAAANRPA